MAETHSKFDQDCNEVTVRPVRETGKPIEQVARDLGINQRRWTPGPSRRQVAWGIVRLQVQHSSVQNAESMVDAVPQAGQIS